MSSLQCEMSDKKHGKGFSMDLSNKRTNILGGGGGGDIDIYVVHYILCTAGSSGIRAVQFLVYCTLYRVCCMYLKQY